MLGATDLSSRSKLEYRKLPSSFNAGAAVPHSGGAGKSAVPVGRIPDAAVVLNPSEHVLDGDTRAVPAFFEGVWVVARRVVWNDGEWHGAGCLFAQGARHSRGLQETRCMVARGAGGPVQRRDAHPPACGRCASTARARSSSSSVCCSWSAACGSPGRRGRSHAPGRRSCGSIRPPDRRAKRRGPSDVSLFGHVGDRAGRSVPSGGRNIVELHQAFDCIANGHRGHDKIVGEVGFESHIGGTDRAETARRSSLGRGHQRRGYGLDLHAYVARRSSQYGSDERSRVRFSSQMPRRGIRLASRSFRD